MIQFSFTVNKSFKKYHSHPITIPKEFYSQLESEQLVDNITIIAPSGYRMGGSIYSGKNNYGQYYQIRIKDYRDYLSNLELDILLNVKIDKDADGVVVYLEQIA